VFRLKNSVPVHCPRCCFTHLFIVLEKMTVFQVRKSHYLQVRKVNASEVRKKVIASEVSNFVKKKVHKNAYLKPFAVQMTI
jgi:hypothetical protein